MQGLEGSVRFWVLILNAVGSHYRFFFIFLADLHCKEMALAAAWSRDLHGAGVEAGRSVQAEVRGGGGMEAERRASREIWEVKLSGYRQLLSGCKYLKDFLHRVRNPQAQGSSCSA